MVKWLKWKTCLAVQHEKGPLVNDARHGGSPRMLTKKIKGGLCFIFALSVFFLIPEEMTLPCIEILEESISGTP